MKRYQFFKIGGTFNVMPNFFYNLNTIHYQCSFENHTKFLPIAYLILTEKSQRIHCIIVYSWTFVSCTGVNATVSKFYIILCFKNQREYHDKTNVKVGSFGLTTFSNAIQCLVCRHDCYQRIRKAFLPLEKKETF